MIKMPIYEIFKINTSRADREGYDISLSYEQACMNDEIVELAGSETIRKLLKILDEERLSNPKMFDGNWIDNPKSNFLNGYICIHVELKNHYRYIKKHGLYINGVKYVRYSCSAGNARNNNVFMIREDLYDRLYWYMACGVSKEVKVVKNKWSAYFGLTTSATYPIPEPRCCVIPDYTVDLEKTFDYVEFDKETEEYSVERKDVTVNGYCPYDGMGTADVGYMRRVAEALEIDYVPSAMVIRNCWIKGCVATMDFHAFADEVAGTTRTIKDLWGMEHDIKEIDIILTESQFKLWKGYSSWQDYLDKLKERDLGWGCTRVSPKRDKRHAFTNYQFLQVLDLDDDDIENICRPTLEWFKDILGNDVMKLVLYLCGSEKEIALDDIQDPVVKALVYNNELIEDNYIKNHILRNLNKKIREAYTGKLVVDGNFSFMISDPYGLLQYALGMKPTGLLKDHEHYNGFWNERNVDTVAGMRSPLTHYSEVNILNLKKTEEMSRWYKWLDIGCTIFNIYGDDTFRSADSDEMIVPFYERKIPLTC